MVFRNCAHTSPVSNAIVYQILYSATRKVIENAAEKSGNVLVEERFGWCLLVTVDFMLILFFPRLVSGGLLFLFRLLYEIEKYPFRCY